jgi:TolB protein
MFVGHWLLLKVDSTRIMPVGRNGGQFPIYSTTPFRVGVSGIGLSQMTIVTARFREEDRSPQAISTIIRADLERSGQFRGTDANEGNVDESTRPDLSKWKHRGADALVAGSVTKAADGRYAVRFRLWDVA